MKKFIIYWSPNSYDIQGSNPRIVTEEYFQPPLVFDNGFTKKEVEKINELKVGYEMAEYMFDPEEVKFLIKRVL